MGLQGLILVVMIFLSITAPVAGAFSFSGRLVHRFSDQSGEETTALLMQNDMKRQKLLAAPTFNYGNDLSWLHYMWIEVGTPITSFLVALDTGSDLFWLPCDCISCSPLSSTYYPIFGKELVEYNPSHSNTSKPVLCNHRLCQESSHCQTPKGHCPYLANYQSEITSSSGFLFEDQLHLATIGENQQQGSIHSPVIIGCGSKQTGVYLDGTAPDGVLGLGPGNISVPSMLAKSGVIPHSYSFCYDMTYSGRLYFGDQGPASQQSTSFSPLKEYSNIYAVEVDHCCVGSVCLKQATYQAQVDTGSSFTYLPNEIYKQVVSEFQRQANVTSVSKGIFDNCFNASLLNTSNIPSLKLVFPMNQSFLVQNPVLEVMDSLGSFNCLAMRPIEGDIGIIGQNFLMGYRMVFDWEKLKLGWSISNCHGIGPNLFSPSQQGRAVAPACITSFFLFLWIAYVINYII